MYPLCHQGDNSSFFPVFQGIYAKSQILSAYKSWVLELDPMSLCQRQIDASATYAQYAVQDGKPAVIWCSDADLQARVKELQTLVTDYAKNMYSQFLLGTKDIYSDADWAEYEQGLKAAGVEEYCELLAEYWYGAK